jgi:hypothetical protein
MTAYQLSLFPHEQPQPLNTKQTKTKKLNPTIIEQHCSTKRAAALLDISTSTLYRYRQMGKAYQKGAWIAQAVDEKNWTVFYK